MTAARRGADVALAGGVGADAWGDWLRERLEAEGVDLTWFARREDVATPIAFVTVDADAQPTRAIYGDGLAAAIAALGDRLVEAVDACDALFLSSNALVGEAEREVSLAARERALRDGKPVILDPNLQLERWRSRVGGGRGRRAAASSARSCQVRRRRGAGADRRAARSTRPRGRWSPRARSTWS